MLETLFTWKSHLYMSDGSIMFNGIVLQVPFDNKSYHFGAGVRFDKAQIHLLRDSLKLMVCDQDDDPVFTYDFRISISLQPT